VRSDDDKSENSDLETAKRRIEAALSTLEDREDPRRVEEVLRARARQLAARKPRKAVAPRTKEETIVAVRRGDTVFGLRTSRVQRIQKFHLCALSAGPPAVIGVVMEAWEPIAVVDIVRPVWRAGHGAAVLAVICASGAGPLAIAIDEVLGPRVLGPLGPVAHLAVLPFVEGHTDDGLLMVDLDALAEWPDLRVD
jgi:hypothetical protein